MRGALACVACVSRHPTRGDVGCGEEANAASCQDNPASCRRDHRRLSEVVMKQLRFAVRAVGAGAALIVIGSLLGACGMAGPAASGSGSPSAAGTCLTPLATGPLPDWAAPAKAPDLPHALGSKGMIVGAVFVTPRSPQDPAAGTKILWISRVPRDGAPLRITATPLGLEAPLVRIMQPANSGPGEIYPSIVEVPFAGCWHVDLTYLPGR
jgi:hypothetical protein